MKPRLAKAARWLKTVVGLFPLSLGGLVLLAVLGSAFYFVGLGRSDLVVLVTSASMAVAAGLTMLAVSLAAFVTARRLRQVQDSESGLKLQVGAESWTGVTLKPPPIPFVEVRWEWRSPARVEAELRKSHDGYTEVVVPRRRALADHIERRIEVRDVLGVASVSWNHRRDIPARILPPPGKLEVETLVQSLYSGDDQPEPSGEPHGDRVDMRRYSPGDPPRLIMWKVYARSRKLMVRVPERAVVTQPRTCAYLVPGSQDQACAALMRTVLERELLGQGWKFGADGSPSSASTPEEGLRILARSGSYDGDGGEGLARFLEEAQRDGYQSCLVVVPPRLGPWVKKVKTALQKSRMRLTVLSAAPGDPDDEPPPVWKRYLFYAEEGKPDHPDRLFKDLKMRHLSFLLYDQHRGRVYPDHRFRSKRAPAAVGAKS